MSRDTHENIQGGKETKQSQAEVKRYLKEQYRKSSQQNIHIVPPKISRPTRPYRVSNSKA